MKQVADAFVIRLSNEPDDDPEQVCMAVMWPSALLSDRFDDLCCGSPAFLGGLADVSGGEFDLRLLEQDHAGFVVGLSGHGLSHCGWSVVSDAALRRFLRVG